MTALLEPDDMLIPCLDVEEPDEETTVLLELLPTAMPVCDTETPVELLTVLKSELAHR